MPPGDISKALRLLAEAAAERDVELRQYPTDAEKEDTDEEPDSECPLFDKFYDEGGGSAIQNMTNFSPLEFQTLWSRSSDFVKSVYNQGRGKKCAVSAQDMLFITLTVLKAGGQWDFLGRLFGFKGPTFERMVLRYVNHIVDYFYRVHVEKCEAKMGMKKLVAVQSTFSTFKYARYATDVTFQQSHRPGGSVQDGKKYYSGKHKLYGYKTEVSVLPCGLAINCTNHSPGSVSDFEMLRRNISFHKSATKKKDTESEIDDFGELSSEYPSAWAILVDKGYQGIHEILRGVHPVKKPFNGQLTLSQTQFNRKVSSDRVIVENYFGRLGLLWNLMSSKWRWAEENYDDIVRLCISLTNFHITNHPLRESDEQFFQRFKNRIYQIGVTMAEKRQLAQRKYREKRRRQMDVNFRESSLPDSQSFSEGQTF